MKNFNEQFNSKSQGVDEGKGIMKQNVGGSLSYQMESKSTQDSLTEALGGQKLSEVLKNGGRARVTVGNQENAALFEDLSSKQYHPDSKRDIGFNAVSSTGNHHSVASDIQDDSVVTVGKVQATAKSLYAAGLLTKDSQGNYQLAAEDNKKN